MSNEKLSELSNNMPKILFGDIGKLLTSIKVKFKNKLKSEGWMQSVNPDAILIKNLGILYEDSGGDKRQDEFCSPKIAQKFLRLIFKREKEKLLVVPYAIEFLKNQFPEINIDQLREYYKRERENLALVSLENFECIDTSLKENKESGIFKNFVGRAKNVYVSTDQEKITLFLKAIENPKFYQDKIFEEPHVLYYAMAACRSGKISPEQYAGLSQWIELKKIYGNEKVKIYSMFDPEGNFTAEAERYFLEYVLNKKIQKSKKHSTKGDLFKNSLLSDKNLEKFKSELKKLPKTDSIFIKLELSDKSYLQDMDFAYHAAAPNAVLFVDDFTDNKTHTSIEELMTEAFGLNKAFEQDKVHHLCLLSISTYQSLINTAFPAHPAKLVPILGEVKKEDVEQTTKNNQRFCSTYYPRPKNIKLNTPSNRFFHKIGTKTTTVIGLHDVYHCMLMSSLNSNVRVALMNSVDAARKYMQKENNYFTSGLWGFTDIPFGGKEQSDEVDAASIFSQIIVNEYFSFSGDFQPELAAIILDVYFDEQKNWSNLGININQLHAKISPLFEQIHKHFNCIQEYANFFGSVDKKPETKMLLLLIAVIYEGLKLNLDKPKIDEKLESIFKEIKEIIRNKITFKNIKKTHFDAKNENMKNAARLYYEGQPSITLFAEFKEELEQEDDGGATLAWHAAENGELGKLKFLLNNNPNLNKPNQRSVTPYEIAYKNGHIDVIRFLDNVFKLELEKYLQENEFKQNLLFTQKHAVDATKKMLKIINIDNKNPTKFSNEEREALSIDIDLKRIIKYHQNSFFAIEKYMVIDEYNLKLRSMNDPLPTEEELRELYACFDDKEKMNALPRLIKTIQDQKLYLVTLSLKGNLRMTEVSRGELKNSLDIIGDDFDRDIKVFIVEYKDIYHKIKELESAEIDIKPDLKMMQNKKI